MLRNKTDAQNFMLDLISFLKFRTEFYLAFVNDFNSKQEKINDCLRIQQKGL